VATNFPSSVDSFTNPTTSDTLASVPHASQHADVNDAVEAIETALLDGAPLHIDDANERVGIGTTSPSQPLHVEGNALIQSGDLTVNAGGNTVLNRAGASASTAAGGIEFQIDGTTYASLHQPSAGSLSTSANVGIGTTSPAYELDVNGDINTSGSLRIGGTPVGEWVAFTPSWDFNGNSITTTGFNYGYYLVVGDLKIVRAGFRYSSSSGGGSLRLVLPSAAGFSRSGIHTYTRDGYAHRYDASANANYLATPFYWNSDTIIGFYHEGGAANVTDTVPVSWGGNDEFFCTLIGRAP